MSKFNGYLGAIYFQIQFPIVSVWSEQANYIRE